MMRYVSITLTSQISTPIRDILPKSCGLEAESLELVTLSEETSNFLDMSVFT